MDGCRVLLTDPELRKEVNYQTLATGWKGEWKCKECKPGFFQNSINNEYCKPMISEFLNLNDNNDASNKEKLKECLQG